MEGLISKLLAVDPGTKAAGWALFQNRKLVEAGLYRGKHFAETAEAIQSSPIYDLDVLVVERPQAYNRLASKANPNDLIPLAMLAGVAVGVHGWRELRAPTPADWKRQLPKEVHHPRIRAVLDERELAVLAAVKAPPSLLHNVLDAIGLGLWALERNL